MDCCLCGEQIQPQKNELGDIVWTQGHNAEPVRSGRCCDDCNFCVVIPVRINGIVIRTPEDDSKTK